MSFFPGKPKDGTKEFEEMRRALSSDKPAGTTPGAPGSAERVEPAGQTAQSTQNAPAAGSASTARPANAGPTLPDQCASVIFADTTCEGTFKTPSSVRIEGQLSGEVQAGNTIHVSEGARVNAKIRASFIVIAGTVEGEVECDGLLELKPTSHVSGEITTKSVSIHEGAFIEGQMHMVRDKSSDSRISATPADKTPAAGPKSPSATPQAAGTEPTRS